MMNMKAENAARNNYGLYAVGAGRAERNGEWGKAAELWQSALTYARTSHCRQWAETRIAYCSNAAARGWGGVNES
ncbi:ANR family transcriptional regulator [Candidatus Erwinia dacicola]|uniref:ANR family transcriptional regulator n=2 Tax=Candidatus Erwinia dacicola TaxID=252393 RepID=A0A328TUB5_9GAMM|nr:ANR family transcriptional regulator [Candidatus Erwinia dacicola]RAP71446.1 hypothetical protein ACZ87_01741 [Candidatus Erwinia dacicola]